MNDNEFYSLFQKRGKNARHAVNEFVAMLPEAYKRRIHKKKGFGSIYEMAAKVGGISKNVVDEAIRIDEKLKEMPETKNMIAIVGLSKVKTVANTVTKETDHEWAEKVAKMTRGALETHIRDSKNPIPGESITTTTQNVEFENFQVKLNPDVILKLKIIKQKMKKGTTWNEVFEQLTDLPTSQPQKNPRPSNPKKRNIATAKRRELEGKCSIDGCNKPAIEIHHKKPWAKYRSHDDLQPLCADHHELAHQSDSTIDQKFRQYKFQFS
jgi:hypothetical protein